jgi:hypothetical protein
VVALSSFEPPWRRGRPDLRPGWSGSRAQSIRWVDIHGGGERRGGGESIDPMARIPRAARPGGILGPPLLGGLSRYRYIFLYPTSSLRPIWRNEAKFIANATTAAPPRPVRRALKPSGLVAMRLGSYCDNANSRKAKSLRARPTRPTAGLQTTTNLAARRPFSDGPRRARRRRRRSAIGG